MNEDNENMLTLQEVAAAMGCSVRRAKKELWENDIPRYLGSDGVRRVDRRDIQWMIDDV